MYYMDYYEIMTMTTYTTLSTNAHLFLLLRLSEDIFLTQP
jgi:hypothetical protein